MSENQEVAKSEQSEGSRPLSVASETSLESHTDATAEASQQPTSKHKIDILMKATGNAPILKRKRWAVEPDKKIGWITEFFKKHLRLEKSESLFLYVNQAFAPAPDNTVGNLYECYGIDGKLVIHYCKSQAWG
ncbi:autophagy protein 12-like [Schistocerca nitens]|uniref:autophagy protein 12-like n=1 Tax=Schistocerca nitens TaxID=7011 RepID=UPI00211908D8|nr:autophagy protein 12-like [Schistocerca nitens]